MIGPGPWSLSNAKLMALVAAQPAPVVEAPPVAPIPRLSEAEQIRAYEQAWAVRWESIN